MNLKQIINDYFSFSKRDRIGIYFILILIVAIYLLPRLFNSAQKVPIQADSTLLSSLDMAMIKSANYPREADTEASFPHYEHVNKNDFKKVKPFSFDPNTLSFDGWVKLGLSERTAKTIINYRNKGGKFYKPEDLKRIWGLPEGFYEHVANYISLSSSYQSTGFQAGHLNTMEVKKASPVKLISINEADTSDFIALPGIGSKLASRIINFREKLGGFYSIEQVGETYGIADTVFLKIKPYLRLNTSSIRKININSASKDELKAHPYIKWPIANAIVEYRNQHGAYKAIEDLKKITLIDDNTFNKMEAYLDL